MVGRTVIIEAHYVVGEFFREILRAEFSRYLYHCLNRTGLFLVNLEPFFTLLKQVPEALVWRNLITLGDYKFISEL